MSGDGKIETVSNDTFGTQLDPHPASNIARAPAAPVSAKIAAISNEWVVRPRKSQKAILRLDIHPIGLNVAHPIIVEASNVCRTALQSLRSRAAMRSTTAVI
jgi:hypothetical protein